MDWIKIMNKRNLEKCYAEKNREKPEVINILEIYNKELLENLNLKLFFSLKAGEWLIDDKMLWVEKLEIRSASFSGKEKIQYKVLQNTKEIIKEFLRKLLLKVVNEYRNLLSRIRKRWN